MHLHFQPPNLLSGALAHEIADAARELACRIELGEFDDLDEPQLAELRALSDMMDHWAAAALAMEARLALLPYTLTDAGGTASLAICN